MKYIDEDGLTNSKIGETGAENSLLWTYQRYLIALANGNQTLSDALGSILRRAMEKCRVEAGIYLQTPSHRNLDPENHDKKMSKDQIFAFSGFSYLNDWYVGKEIWREMKRQGIFRYDNLHPEKPRRWFAPMDVAFYGYCAGSRIAMLFIWLTALACIVSCLSEKNNTSGKLLAFVKCHTLMKNSFIMRQTYRICTKLLKKKGGWRHAFIHYFEYKDNHPTDIEIKQLFPL